MWLSKCMQRWGFTCVLTLASGCFAQTNTLPQISAIDATNYLNRQVVVVDQVVQVATRSNIWLLHLNQKYPKSPLNAVIRKSYTNNFPNFGGYLGRRVEINGTITEYRGRLEIALTTTNQIRILDLAQALLVATEEVPAEPKKASLLPTSMHVTLPPKETAAGTTNNSGALLYWILGMLAVISVLLACGLFMFWRRNPAAAFSGRSRNRLLPAQEVSSAENADAEAWKQRALAAEAVAGQQGQMLREKMIPELTEFAKQSLVQGLYAQRTVLMETQRKAQLALTELEARLNSVQAPLGERIRMYETRIAELEKEVETQGEEMRELTRATLTLVRRKLEDERENDRLQSRFN